MEFLIILTYFIIGFIVGSFIYDYYCKDFVKRNNVYTLKMTWEEYSYKEGPGVCMTIAMIFWPVLAIIAICYYIFQYPIDYIKKRNGIK